MKQILLGTVVGGLVFFIFLAISWTVLPFHTMAFSDIEDTQPIAEALQMHGLPSGLYTIPSMMEYAADQETFVARHEAGPVVPFLVYYAEGMPVMNAMMYVKGIIIALLAAFVASLLLKLATPSLSSYIHRVLLVTGLGVFGALIGPLTLGNWMMFPAGYVWADVFDFVVGWFIVGLAIAAFVKKPAVA